MHLLARTTAACSFLAGVALLVLACGTDAVGVDACRKIEAARCAQAPGCPGVQLAVPVHSGSDVDACVRFYRDQCLHGLVTSNEPGAVQVQACVDAINDTSVGTQAHCAVVLKPETNVTACGWLVPPPDAGSAVVDAGPTDTGTDALSE